MVAAFELSSPDLSEFGNSPAGRALRKARIDAESNFLAAFDSPDVPGGDSTTHVSSPIPFNCQPSSSSQSLEDERVAAIRRTIAEVEEEIDSDNDHLSSNVSESEAESEDDHVSAGVSIDNGSEAAPEYIDRYNRSGARSTSKRPSANSSTPFLSSSSSLSVDMTLSNLEKFEGGLKGTLKQQREVHATLCSTTFCHFRCKCSVTSESCLESGLDRSFFRAMHNTTYGRAPDFHTLAQVNDVIHQAIWELRQPLPEPRREGRIFSVPVWRLGGAGGKVVCKKAFTAVLGGKAFAHRQALALTIAGVQPSDKRALRAASSLAIQAVHKTSTTRGDWATSWWKQHLMWQDWLPNEMKIQYRGPTWTIVHKKFYLTQATRCNMALGPKQWMRQRTKALAQLHQEFFPSIFDKRLTLSRSARHSKFPECTDCQRLRETYKTLASSSKSSADQVATAYNALTAHAALWQQDRETAIDLRHRYSVHSSLARYFVDDKCGSFWQQLPVSLTGRDTKENAKDKYKFSIHANVVCGESGHKRFCFVPKNIKTGGNFGLTNLLMSIHLAVTSGNMAPHVETLVRHTDGGPDNVSVVTHFIHWMLVYLGVVNKVIWFRFKAGHSHTETADRLFSIIKRLFESDGQQRVVPIEDFPSLIPRIAAEFENETEACTFHWNFANWDLRKMMDEMNVVSSSLKGISSKMVYQYSYDEHLPEHGCVLVQYKNNISWKGNAREAEWSPIVRVQREMNAGDGEDEVQTVECNVSRPKGVRFVSKPPDLRILPRREPFDTKSEKFSPSQQCKAIVTKRWDELSSNARSFWKCLSLFHRNAGDGVAEKVPVMPHTINTEQRSFTFDGSPRPFVDVMKTIILRFPRPLLPSNPFETSPAESWEAALEMSKGSSSSRRQSSVDTPASAEELRDPRLENTVQNLELSESEMRANSKELAEEEFANSTPTRVEDVEVGQLYLCELEEAEHGIRLGLAMAEKEGPLNEDNLKTWTVAWFKITSKKGWATKNIAFEPHLRRGRRETDDLDIRSFRLHIEDSYLTKV